HGITPTTIVKALPEMVSIKKLDAKKEKNKKKLSLEEKIDLINELEEEMRAYAKDLNFEMAAQIRDAILELKAGR
ncbi:MAG: UvrB/UvrC motif-containing protein, partial [Anaeroplasmataceae bacterium]|nr:UvrB/UvrC motif-containing protein [Anaeroplasmataceae bacterium]